MPPKHPLDNRRKRDPNKPNNPETNMDDIEYLLRIEQMQKDYSRLADELAKMRYIQIKMMAELDCDKNVRKLSAEIARLRVAMRSALVGLDALFTGGNLGKEDGELLEAAQTTLETALGPAAP